uniref:Uncharacterized protein n=1 Tax=Seriola lalandi dorsalis TaxID=1841481 RepID=A0A3B4YC88_SERLL
LYCSFQGRWSTREIVCEENYMETCIVQLLLKSCLFLFVWMLCVFLFFLQVSGVDLEILSATVLYRLQSNFLAVDTTVACALNEATTDGSDLLWTVPFNLSPLVHGQFRDRGMTVGVNSQALNESDIKERRYKIGLQEGRVEVRIPTGAPGGHIKSGVVRGRYSQSMSVDLFFMRQWEDERWPLTQHRSFRLLKTPAIPQTPILTNSTVPSEGLFSVTLGPFAPDVSLQKVTIDGGGDLLTWTQSLQTQTDTDLSVSRLSHVNGSFSYQFSFPLSHPKIIPEVRTYSFTFTFTLNISPSREVFYHQATVEHISAFHILLVVTKKRSTVFILVYNIIFFARLSLLLHLSVVDAESLKLQDSLVHRCTFPARELIVCLPEGRMVAVVDTTHTIPPTHPNRTALSDPKCVPMETDSARALLFTIHTANTRSTEGDFLVYENQISYTQDFLPLDDPVIHRDSPYRLTIQCRYPANHTSTLAIQHPVYTSLDLSPMMPVKRTRREAANTGVLVRVRVHACPLSSATGCSTSSPSTPMWTWVSCRPDTSGCSTSGVSHIMYPSSSYKPSSVDFTLVKSILLVKGKKQPQYKNDCNTDAGSRQPPGRP